MDKRWPGWRVILPSKKDDPARRVTLLLEPTSAFVSWLPRVALACDQALQGAPAAEQEKEGELATTLLWNLNICIKKLGAKCWLAEMTLVMTSVTFARVFQCSLTFALVSASRWLADIWKLSRRRATKELEVEFKFQRRSRKLSFLFLPCLQSEVPVLWRCCLYYIGEFFVSAR